MEALTLRQLRNGTAGGVPGRDLRKGFQVAANCIEIDLRPKSAQAIFIDQQSYSQELLLRAEDDYAGVDEFLALGTRDNADYRVIIRAQFGHGAPPVQSSQTLPAAG